MRPETLERLAKQRVDRLDLLTGRLVAVIERTNPGYRDGGVVPTADLWASCHDNLDRVLDLLARDEPVTGQPPIDPVDDPDYDAARATGRQRAEQGLPLDDVLRSFRLGGRLIWDDLVEQAARSDRDAAVDEGELREVGSRLWEVVDQTSAQVAAAYHAHERATVRADAQRRAELWEGLATGRARDARFAHEAARILDLPVAGDLLVVAAHDLDLAAAERALAPHATAWSDHGRGAVGIVALREAVPDEALADLDGLLGRRPSVRLGVSAVVAGLRRIDAGFRQASLALAGLAPGGGGVARFDDRLPESLLLAAPDVADRLVEVWLGALLATGDGEGAALLATLEAWVAAGGSPTATAAAVPCHRNTVLNRLRRYGDLTGRRLVDGPPPVELDLALRAHRALGRRAQ